MKHRTNCVDVPTDLMFDPEEEIQRRLETVEKANFIEPPERMYNRCLCFCHTCNMAIGLCKEDKELEEHLKPAELRQLEYCRGATHDIQEGHLFKLCAHCRNPVPLNRPGNTRKHRNNHQCYIRRHEPKIGKETDYWVWDIETFTREVPNDNGGKSTRLIPILLCMVRLDGDPATAKGFYCKDCVKQFLRHICTAEPKSTAF